MSGFGRASDLILAAALSGAAATGALAAPERVVSINLCTDILAMTLAPDLLVGVSPIADDPTSSAMADVAAGFTAHGGRAEDIFLMKPDLVLAGSFSERTTVDMLRRLGIEVAEFPPATSLEQMKDHVIRMGDLLGRETEAASHMARFDAALNELAQNRTSQPLAVPYFANGYALGTGTLIGAVLEAAGFRNAAAEAGLSGGGNLNLETLVFLEPDIIVTGERYPAASRSEAILDHPALRSVTGGADVVVVPDREWICGTPHLLAAITRLSSIAEDLE